MKPISPFIFEELPTCWERKFAHAWVRLAEARYSAEIAQAQTVSLLSRRFS